MSSQQEAVPFVAFAAPARDGNRSGAVAPAVRRVAVSLSAAALVAPLLVALSWVSAGVAPAGATAPSTFATPGAFQLTVLGGPPFFGPLPV